MVIFYLLMSDSNYSSDSDSSVSSFEELDSVSMKGGKSKATKKSTKTSSKKTSKNSKKSSKKKSSKKSSKKTTSKKSSKKSSKKTSSKKSSEKKSSKKSSKKSKKKASKSADGKPKKKRELNPIMKRMNVLRNEHIGSHIGTKAPMKTIPPFKLVMAEARKQMKLNEKDKNTVEVVDKAIEIFNASPAKYCK